MRINLSSVMVDDQERALRFYTQMLGFQTKHNIPLGKHRWITLVSPEAVPGAGPASGGQGVQGSPGGGRHPFHIVCGRGCAG